MQKELLKKPSFLDIKIPDCCKEGREDCPHVPKKEKKQKVNIGL